MPYTSTEEQKAAHARLDKERKEKCAELLIRNADKYKKRKKKK